MTNPAKSTESTAGSEATKAPEAEAKPKSLLDLANSAQTREEIRAVLSLLAKAIETLSKSAK